MAGDSRRRMGSWLESRHRGVVFAISVWFAVLFSLCFWTVSAESSAHYTPEYDPVDITPLLDGRILTDADYELLFQQTGLARPGIEQLYEEGNEECLLILQDRLFAEVDVTCEQNMFLVWSEWLEYREPENAVVPEAVLMVPGREGDIFPGKGYFPALQDGDILVSFSSHIFGWRSGHAGLVVDVRQGLTLEAIAVGYDSAICSLEDWTGYPSVAVLRLKGASREERARVASYAAGHLAGIPYRLTSITSSVRDQKAAPPSGTQCAHLVWLAYAHFGYDLNSDGGLIVTPADLYESDLLEVVQVYGIG